MYIQLDFALCITIYCVENVPQNYRMNEQQTDRQTVRERRKATTWMKKFMASCFICKTLPQTKMCVVF